MNRVVGLLASRRWLDNYDAGHYRDGKARTISVCGVLSIVLL